MEPQTHPVPLSENLETEGFDLQAGQTWIYPTNYPTRDYQYNIVQQALLKNTLVSLPTGLGKTFIAAVVMYNFYRWYPQGKIIFMAPTKPLVKQQVEACYSIMAIPPQVTAELTGTKVSASRSSIWLDKRVFFITPQVLQNDLEKVTELGPKIKCLVFDEAHKAKGNHAYCQVVRKLLDKGFKHFRVLALSATPGCNVNDVSEVVHNLLIAHLEFRTEESRDVQQYVFHRSLETVVVPLGLKLTEVRDEYLQILEPYVRTLLKYKVIQGNCGSLTKGKIFMVMKDFQNKNRGSGSSNYSEIMRCLNVCVTLYHAFELLVRHGLRSFLSFFDEHIEKPLLRGNIKLKSILEDVRSYLGPIPPIEVLPDGTYPEISKDIKFGHPKYYKLRDILNSHFSGPDKKNTRVIVFFEYRESVVEAHTLLLQSRPLVQPKIFLGQGSGVTQKTQIGVVKAFREGKCNTLLSTCIGEEGLDVGEVDLIVCFDISNKSPIRMVQRMGRTGRKRAGNVLVLVTEGKEQQTLKDCLVHKNNISTFVLGSVQLRNGLYPCNSRLVPSGLTPRCEKIFITVTEKAKNNNILDKLRGAAKITFTQTNDLFRCRDWILETRMKCFTGNPLEKSDDSPLFHRHIEKMRTVQKTCLIRHSDSTSTLNDLLRYADSKRFNIPIKRPGETAGKPLKQGDIRSLFTTKRSACPAIEITQTECTPTEPRDPTLPSEELFKILSNYLVTELTNDVLKCPCCSQGFYCEAFALNDRQSLDESPVLMPSDEVVNNIALEDIESFISALNGSVDTKATMNESLNEKTFTFEAPSTYLKILETLKVTDFVTQAEPVREQVSDEAVLEMFKLDSVADLFDKSLDSSQETVVYVEDEPKTDCNNKIPKDVSLEDFCDLSDFGLADFEQTYLRRSKPLEKALEPAAVTITQIVDDLNRPSSKQPEPSAKKSSAMFKQPVPSSSKGREQGPDKLYASKAKTKYNKFLDMEAEVSLNESFSEDEADNDSLNVYEKSFVNDVTQHFDSDIHGLYLRSIRSPNKLQIRRPLVNIVDVYSQAPPMENSEYLEDSFCVASGDEEEPSQLSQLEILERQLELKKRKKSALKNSGTLKRRRIKHVPSDESE